MSAISPEILASIGDPKAVSESLQSFGEDAAWLEEHCPELTKQYPNQYVAKVADGILRASTFEDLMTRLKARGIDPTETAFSYLSPHPIIIV